MPTEIQLVTSSWRNSPPITSPTGSMSSRRRWDRPSSRSCRSGSFTASGRQPPPNSTPLVFGPASTFATSPHLSAGEFRQVRYHYYWTSRGIDERPMRANRVRESVGAENTFLTDLTEFDAMVAELHALIDKVWRHCESTATQERTVTLKVKFAGFEISRAADPCLRCRGATISRVWRSAGWKTSCRFQKRCASWEHRCPPCKARTTRSRNRISEFELNRAHREHSS